MMLKHQFIFIALLLPGCSYISYSRSMDGSVVASGFEIGTDTGLTGFKYQNGEVSMAIDSMDKNQTAALSAVTEAAVKGALKGVKP